MTPITIRFNSDAERQLQLVPHLQLEKLRSGDGDLAAFEDVACRVNFAAVMAKRHFEAPVADVCKQALFALLAVQKRYAEKGKWGMTGDEFLAIADGLNMADDIQLNSTRRDMKNALLAMAKAA